MNEQMQEIVSEYDSNVVKYLIRVLFLCCSERKWPGRDYELKQQGQRFDKHVWIHQWSNNEDDSLLQDVAR